MDKQAKKNIDGQPDMFDDFIQEVFGKSPLEEASELKRNKKKDKGKAE